jgi:hypothetical protein
MEDLRIKTRVELPDLPFGVFAAVGWTIRFWITS